MRVKAFAWALAALSVALPAVAQTPAPPEPADALSELVVIAHPPGPALWRVQVGNSTLVILGAVSPMPQQLRWDQRQVFAALTGARLLFTPPKPDLGPLQIVALVTSNIWKVRQSKALEPTLPPDIRARFVAARTHDYQPESRYAHWKPAVAGFLLLSDYRRSWGLSQAKPASTVEKTAQEMHVPQKALGSYKLNLFMQVASKLDDRQNLECLTDTLTQMEEEGRHAQDLDDDWARGDIKAVAARYRASPLQRCLELAPGAPALIDHAMQDATDRLWSELQKPGKTVAVIDLAWLMPQGGLLDRLKAKGATVSAPAALTPSS